MLLFINDKGFTETKKRKHSKLQRSFKVEFDILKNENTFHAFYVNISNSLFALEGVDIAAVNSQVC